MDYCQTWQETQVAPNDESKIREILSSDFSLKIHS